MSDWQSDSWQKLAAKQQPVYEDETQLAAVLHRLRQYPPLVSVAEITQLQTKLEEVGRGQAFILQGGACAERFADCRPQKITAELDLMQKMSACIQHGGKMQVVQIGRIAGQYAKPRSRIYDEILSGGKIPVFRGDIVNSIAADATSRKADPKRLEQGYFHAATTLNFMRSLGSDLFTSHEGLVLVYEQAMTRYQDTRYHNLGAHMLWIGDRTRQRDHAHVEYCRGIANPIGIKAGPLAEAEELAELVQVLNTTTSKNKIVLITRFGKDRVAECLPTLIETCKKNKKLEESIVWIVDPMHGNTRLTTTGMKTRSCTDIVAELQASFAIHKDYHNILGGVHLELSGDRVTECLGGQLTENDLKHNYASVCDPRLNPDQSLEIAAVIADCLAR